jgi:hypothetical protein
MRVIKPRRLRWVVYVGFVVRFKLENLKGRNNLRDLDIDGRILGPY